MRTPKAYADRLAAREITPQMLSDALYSVNKRAKNWRDKERELRQRYHQSWDAYDKYDSEGKARDQKEEYYRQKETLLSVLTPVCIHREPAGFERERIYDYDKRYAKYEKSGAFVWENCYYDHDREMEVWFGDIELKDKPKYHYYLFYRLAGRSFHSPIAEEELETTKAEYRLSVSDIDQLETEGRGIEDLMSCQFVTKLLDVVESGDYKLVGFPNDMECAAIGRRFFDATGAATVEAAEEAISAFESQRRLLAAKDEEIERLRDHIQSLTQEEARIRQNVTDALNLAEKYRLMIPEESRPLTDEEKQAKLREAEQAKKRIRRHIKKRLPEFLERYPRLKKGDFYKFRERVMSERDWQEGEEGELFARILALAEKKAK